AKAMAERGYMAVSYDGRGQGRGVALSSAQVHGRSNIGMRERSEMCETIEAVEVLFPSVVDRDRIGVTGRSQGGIHSWVAAAHSGKTPPQNPWRSQPFPTIKAVAPINFIPDILEGTMPGGNTGTEMLIRMIYDSTNGIHNHPSFFATVDSFIRDEDFPGLRNAFYDADLDLVALLQNSTVPIQSFQVYDDKYASSNRLMNTWNSLAPNAQKLLNVSTTGHSTIFNNHEDARREFRRDQWFDFHLKQVDNQVNRMPEFRFGITPLSISDFQDANFLWEAREFDSYPIPGATTQTWYLHRDRTLSLSPHSQRQKRSFQQSVDGAIGDIDDYIAFLPHPDALEQDVQLDSEEFETPTFQEDQLMIGEPVVVLTVDTEDADFQIHAALFSEPEGKYLTGGQVTVRDHGGGETTVSFPLNFQGFKIEKGTSLRLELENLAWHRPEVMTQPTVLQAIPVFEDFDLDIFMGGSATAELQLPVVPLSGPALTTETLTLQRRLNSDFSLQINSDESRDGWAYTVLAGSDGTEPGHFLGGTHVPLNRDWLTDSIEQNPGGLPIAGFTGNLDQNGSATVDVFLSNITRLPNKIDELDFVVILHSQQGGNEVSYPVIIPVD
ncbi:MAG: hypothetical protein H8E15_00855, partial [Planctomycetes bacterium]|nr:hypothetical protein [Planctomycetota bacterium]